MNRLKKAPGQFSDQRSQVRYAISAPVPGKLCKGSGESLEAVYVDVSERGLGIFLVDDQIQIGERIVLLLEGQEPVTMRICWTRPTDGTGQTAMASFCRAGLCVEPITVNLLKILRTYSCVE